MILRRIIHRVPLAVIACLGLALQTANAQITYVSADRGINVSASGFCTSPSNADSTTVLGAYTVSLSVHADGGGDIGTCQAEATGSASQMTELLAWSIGGTGNASSDAAFGGDSSASSTLAVDFTLNASYPYTLSGTLGGKYEEFFPNAVEAPGEARVVLSDGSGVIHEAQQTTISDFPYSFSGTLVPGTYTLEATAITSASSDSWDRESFDFLLNVVPEPSSGGLLVVGLLGTVLARRRRRQPRRVGS
jgi:hypothetical protein